MFLADWSSACMSSGSNRLLKCLLFVFAFNVQHDLVQLMKLTIHRWAIQAIRFVYPIAAITFAQPTWRLTTVTRGTCLPHQILTNGKRYLGAYTEWISFRLKVTGKRWSLEHTDPFMGTSVLQMVQTQILWLAKPHPQLPVRVPPTANPKYGASERVSLSESHQILPHPGRWGSRSPYSGWNKKQKWLLYICPYISGQFI